MSEEQQQQQQRQQKPLVVITGASSGIGAATAKIFSKHGHPLLLLARRVEQMESLNLPNCMCEEVDVTDAEAFADAVRKAEDKWGPVHCLVNNAAVMFLGDLARQDVDECLTMNETNINGVLVGIRTVLPRMKEREDGVIINISSIAGQRGFPSHAAYCGTKFAVRGITQTLQQEYGKHGVKVVSICPGAVETELPESTTDDSLLEKHKEWMSSFKRGLLQPEDVANAICFAYNQPKHCLIREITLAPIEQEQ